MGHRQAAAAWVRLGDVARGIRVFVSVSVHCHSAGWQQVNCRMDVLSMGSFLWVLLRRSTRADDVESCFHRFSSHAAGGPFSLHFLCGGLLGSSQRQVILPTCSVPWLGTSWRSTEAGGPLHGCIGGQPIPSARLRAAPTLTETAAVPGAAPCVTTLCLRFGGSAQQSG